MKLNPRLTESFGAIGLGLPANGTTMATQADASISAARQMRKWGLLIVQHPHVDQMWNQLQMEQTRECARHLLCVQNGYDCLATGKVAASVVQISHVHRDIYTQRKSS